MDLKDKLTAKLAIQNLDWALAAICGLLVFGWIFFVFGLASYVFFDADRAWTFWLIGFGSWMFALSVFFTFMNNPYPKHRRYR